MHLNRLAQRFGLDILVEAADLTLDFEQTLDHISRPSTRSSAVGNGLSQRRGALGKPPPEGGSPPTTVRHSYL